MISNESYIYPMMIEINKTVKDTVYYFSLPKIIKEKWIELERKSKATYNPKYNLPTNTLKENLCTFLDGIVDMKPVSEHSDDTKWLVSFKKINVNIVVNCLKIWVTEFYIKGNLNKDYKRKTGGDDDVLKVATEFINLLSSNNFNGVFSEKVTLFDKGKAVDEVCYRLYPLRLIDYLMGKSIMISGIETKLLYSGSNELTTNTRDFHYKDNYFSYVIRLTVQTLPPDNKVYLIVDLSLRRWISQNEKGGYIYLPNNKNCYIRVSGNRLQSIQTNYNQNEKENTWRTIDLNCFKETQIYSEVPKFTDVLNHPEEYNSGNVGDVLIPYEEGIEGINTMVKSGLPFGDRETVLHFVKQEIYQLDHISSNIKASQVKKIAQNKRVDFEGKDDEEINREVFLEQLDKALDGEKLTVELYAKGELCEAILSQLQLFIEKDALHEIICYDDEFYYELVKTPMSKHNNIPGFEKRVDEITRKLNNVSTPTLAIIAIHDQKFYRKLDYKINVDPKEAIRSGFAKTGRLTQFLTFEEFERENQRINESDEKYEARKKRADEKGEKLQARNKTDHINRVVNGAALDGFRQLGIVFNYEMNKYLKGKKIIGVHICNYKRTNYGTIPPFPIIITYDVDSSQIMVYSDLVDKVDVPYWKAILELSKLAAEKNMSNVRNSISNTTIFRRLDRIVSKDDKDTVIIFDANGTSRKWIQGITNSKLAATEKNEFNQVEKMLVTDNRWIDFTETNKGISVIRLRHNNEISSYFPMNHETNESKFKQVSGLFKYNSVYYSIDGRPSHENKGYDKQNSKSNSPASYSHRNMIELYPIYVSGDTNSHGNNEIIAIGLVDMLRNASIQYTAQKTVLPLPLHLALKMEEYI